MRRYDIHQINESYGVGKEQVKKKELLKIKKVIGEVIDIKQLGEEMKGFPTEQNIVENL